MPLWSILLIILVILVGAFIALTLVGKRAQKKQAEQQEQMEASKQVITMLVIDKKKVRLKDAGFPQIVVDSAPKLMRRSKLPVVKAKVGPKITSFLCDKDVFDVIPLKKEVKATVSGLYIMSVKGMRGALVSEKAKKRAKKENSTFQRLLKKGRGEL